MKEILMIMELYRKSIAKGKMSQTDLRKLEKLVKRINNTNPVIL